MKNLIQTQLVLLLLFCSSCKKPNKECNNGTSDYRDKFVGNYQCSKTGVYHCGDSTFYHDTTTIIVTITKENDSLIHILDAILKINANGEFGGGLYPDTSYHGFGGYFINDSIFFDTYQGGLGCFTSFSYKGKRM